MKKKNRSQRVWREGLIVLIAMILCSPISRSQIGSNTVDWGVQPMDFSRVGTAGWQFMKLPTDARSVALGGVQSALGFGNANSSFNNPASIADVADMDIQFSSMNWVADIKYSTIAFVKNFGGIGTVGVNCAYLNYGTMMRTRVAEGFDASSGASLGIIPLLEGQGTFGAHDLALGVSFSRQITNALQVGGTLRYLEEQIDDAKMKTWALDIGTMYWTGLGSLRISMLGRNFGSDGEFESYADRVAQPPAKVRLPMQFILGTAYDVLETKGTGSQRLTIAAEYVKPNDGPDKYRVGMEYFAFSNIYLRGGYKFNYDEESFTFGFGAEYGVAEPFVIKMDYAFAKLGRFQSAQIFTVGMSF
ncbi:MAG: PorV/PorQ family protein [Ignavibacteriales bacterium]|nr:PorV/PorQ family protein [Ignavibacteriales bacterium]